MKGRQSTIEWDLIGAVALVIILLAGVFTVIAWAATNRVYDEPTSRCIDVKYRIFERGGEEGFSVVEDPRCAE